MKKLFFIGILSLSSMLYSGPAFAASSVAANQPLDYTLWAKILNEHVNDEGRVDYEKLLRNRSDLDKLVEQIRLADISSLSKSEEVAFWINAYNALTIRLIVDKYPLKFGGIRSINWGRPWSIKMQVAGQKLTLGDIEHEILRPRGDPRIHFALNCASIGCPKLPKKPFYPDQLEELLDYETKRFMNDPEKIRLDRSANTLYHSELFDWFEDDFLVVADDQLSYIKKYINENDRVYLDTHKVTLKKIKYDWRLNKQ